MKVIAMAPASAALREALARGIDASVIDGTGALVELAVPDSQVYDVMRWYSSGTGEQGDCVGFASRY
jgi:hypothetical protein